ncbi:MAG: DUF1376 domain-containing protein [Rudaea sp.]|nr:DUF1376 domain-containing protein [Rudaea sp.]
MGFDSADVARPVQANSSAPAEPETSVSAELPAPLVPAHADLRKLEYMPLLGGRLFTSDFHLTATDTEWRIAVTLWWAAWRQVPAGSLPADDTSLAQLCHLGVTARALARFRKVRAKVLSGFVPCSDGRLYHRVLCEQVLIALDRRSKELDRKAKWRERRRGHDGDTSRGDGDETGTGDDCPRSVPSDGTVRYETVRKELITNNGYTHPTATQGIAAEAERACLLMQKAGCNAVNASHPNLIDALKEEITPEELAATAAEAVGKKGIESPFAWAIQTARSRRANAQPHQQHPRQPEQPKKFWKSERRLSDEQRSESLSKGLSGIFAALGIGGGGK